MINREVIEKLLREDVRGDCVVEVELAGQKFQLEILEIKRVNIGDGKPRTAVKVEPGEDMLGTAKRELLEETGYVAGDWRRLTTIHNAIGYSDEAIELYAARGLSLQKQDLDEEEILEVLELPFAAAIAMVRDGRITDVKTIVALLWLEAFAEK